jgi:hypothetical protein
VQLEVIIDEGTGLAMHGIAPFTKQPVALVGTAEKQLQSVQVGTMLDLANNRMHVMTRISAHGALADKAP